MRTRRGRDILITAMLILAACGNTSTGQDDSTSIVAGVDTTQTTTTVEVVTSTSTQPPPPLEVPTAYLVELSNLVADYMDRAAGFGHEYTVQHARPVTEQERIDFMAGYLNGWADIALAHAATVGAVNPPSAFEDVHREYAETLRELYEEWQRIVSGFTTSSELEAFFASVADPAAAMPGALADLQRAFMVACENEEHAAAEAGYELDLHCPGSPSDVFEVSVDAGQRWAADPAYVPIEADLVAVQITNTGFDAIRPVVLDVFAGDPLDLPVGEGLVDITRSGVIDPSSGHAAFGLAYPGRLLGDDGRLLDQPPQLSPGESITVQLWISGQIVVFDYRDGEYEAGSYVVIERR